MAYLLRFASGDSVLFASDITAPSSSFSLEYTVDTPNAAQWGTVFLTNNGLPTTTAGSFGSQRNNLTQEMNIWFTLDGKARVIYIFPVTFSAGQFTVRVEWDSTTNAIRLYKDGNLLNTWNNYNSFNIAALKGIAENGGLVGDLYAFTVTVDGTVYTYDPSASNGTGSTLPDTTGSNNGTLTGFPVDDSQWVPYADTITGTSTHQAVTATHSASGKSTPFFTLAGTFAPNQTITLSLFNSPATPSEIRLIDSNSNLITRSLSAIGGNQYTFTLPAIPTAGNNSAGVLFGSISAELVL